MLPFPQLLVYGNSVAPPPTIKKIQFFSNGPMMLLSDGRLYARGQNGGQMFGDGSAANTIYTGDWRLVNSNVKDFWTEGGASIAIMYDNTIQTTGAIRGLTGGSALSTNIWTDRTSYFNTAGISIPNITQIAWTPYNCYIVMNSGVLYSAGTNASGQHGYGNTTAITALQVNPNFTNVKKIQLCGQSSGFETIICLDTSGNLTGAGNSSHGELLLNGSATAPRALTTAVLDFNASGYCFHAIKSDGLYVGGSQFNGQLGDGVNSSNIGNVGRTILFKIATFTTAPDYVYNYNYTTIVRYNNTWYGAGTLAKIGYGTNSSSPSFTVLGHNVPRLTDIIWSIGSNNSYTVATNGLLYGSGSYSASLDLLPGYTSNQYSFVQLSTSGIS